MRKEVNFIPMDGVWGVLILEDTAEWLAHECEHKGLTLLSSLRKNRKSSKCICGEPITDDMIFYAEACMRKL